MRYEFLEHTADKKFKAYGKTLEEAFSNAVLACTAALIEPEQIKAEIQKKIVIAANNYEQLLYDLVDELIFLMDTEGFITGNVDKLSIKKEKDSERFELSTTIDGDFVKNYDIGGDIKSPTYNEMIVNEKDCWVQMVLDI